jgi:hypothetical protein
MPTHQRPARPSEVCATDTIDYAPKTGQFTNGMFVSCQHARVTTGGPAGPRPGRVRRSMPRPDSHVGVLFGAIGALTRRKLLPGLSTWR